MQNKINDKIQEYRATVTMLLGLKEKGLITETELSKLERMFANSYGLENSVIHRDRY